MGLQRRVAWITLKSLTATICRAAIDGTVTKTIARIVRADLIVDDDIGMLPAGQASGEAFYRLIDAADEGSIAITVAKGLIAPDGTGEST